MTPVLQTLVALAIRVLLRLLLLRQMPLAVRNDLAHVGQVFFIVLLRVFLWILLQDLDDLAAALCEDSCE